MGKNKLRKLFITTYMVIIKR